MKEGTPRGSTTWKEAVREIVLTLPPEFSLKNVLAYHDALQRMFPGNRFIDAKIRQSLQILRDQGLLEFVRPGYYRRFDVAPSFSPLIDLTLTTKFVSAAQAARVALETWASFNLYCINCESDSLDRLRDNTPVADFKCFACEAMYQLKGKNGRFGARIIGAAYQPTVEAVRSGNLPEYILVEFDTRFATVVFVDAVPGPLISEERIIPENHYLPRRAVPVGKGVRSLSRGCLP